MAETLNGSWIQRYRTNNNRTIMENAELLKAILERLGVSEQEFTETAAEVISETLENDMLSMIYVNSPNWTQNQA